MLPPQNIIDQAQIAKIKVYKVIRDSKTNFKFDVKEKYIRKRYRV